ncbi:MAG: type II toxin-antitoxin system HicB family antitoxin, partial [Desulfotignum sp.]
MPTVICGYSNRSSKRIVKRYIEAGRHKGVNTMLTYPAHIVKDDDIYLVSFPDLENVSTYGSSIEEALANAEEALNGCLESD